jgi:hypothetical protein
MTTRHTTPVGHTVAQGARRDLIVDNQHPLSSRWVRQR